MSFDLDRFVHAQAPLIAQVERELSTGRKRSHWMWFVFPQLVGLGHSAMAQHYAIKSLDEARAYLAHAVLGPRLKECTTLVTEVENCSAQQIFGSPDDLKFHSCMTLFDLVMPEGTPFKAALDRHFGGMEDAATIRLAAGSDI